MRWFRSAAAATAFVVWTAVNAHAGAVMHINDGTAYLFANEVHPVSSPTVSILENGSGNPTLANPLLLILGIPNTTAFAAPSLSLSAGTGQYGDGSAFGLNYNANATGTSNGGLFNSGEVYSFLGLTAGDNSNNFGNWAAADLAVNGLTASGFGIYVYELTNTGMSGGHSINATFGSALPVGTFVVAYGQAGKKVFSTPFTETGLGTGGFTPQEVNAPEPGSMILLGSGLTALYARRRRQHAKKSA